MNWGCQQLAAQTKLPRHRHAEPHLTLVLSGAYEEAGDDGRWRATAGDVIVHRSYRAHANNVARHAEVLNLPAPADLAWRGARCDAVDEVVRAARDDLATASRLIISRSVGAAPVTADWPDLLAARLADDPWTSIGAWAEEAGVAREHVSRAFHVAYAVSPKRFRAECRAHRAFSAILGSTEPLAAIAADLGFSDQAHMTRAVRALCGKTPQQIRRQFAER
jgi:AraC-like DNA-binding protein